MAKRPSSKKPASAGFDTDDLEKIGKQALETLEQIDLSPIGKIIPRKIIPPIYFIIALVLMWALSRYAPVSHLIYLPLRVFGGLLALVGLIITAHGAWTFKQAGTAIKPFDKPTQLVTDGLFQYTRNPMYLGMMLMLTGFWIALGTFSPVIVIPIFFIIIQEGFIKYEEVFMEEHFGNAYLDYKDRVFRWLGWRMEEEQS